MSKPEVWTLDRLLKADLGKAVVWASAKVVSVIRREMQYRIISGLDEVPQDLETLIVVGGGERIDLAKAWRHDKNQDIRLVAIPSIWGSGAEASPIVVLNQDGRKNVRMGVRYLPDIRCVWPDLAGSIPEPLARNACGDCWSHALEGFLSPLAGEDLRAELAELMLEMIDLPLGNDPRWFEPSARACAGQARSSVGLVHGIAHVLEGPLRSAYPGSGWGHAKLCSTFLWPVMLLNRGTSGNWNDLMAHYGLDGDKIMAILKNLFDEESFNEALPLLSERWKDILRDPCTRTNSAVVRPKSLSYFLNEEKTFQ